LREPIHIFDVETLNEKSALDFCNDRRHRPVHVSPFLDRLRSYPDLVFGENSSAGNRDPVPSLHEFCEFILLTVFKADDLRKLRVCDPVSFS
jgi:hypothetical protein